VVKYGEISAIKRINFTANAGELTTIIGSNGAGKSTLLKTISGLLKPASGKIIFEGKEIGGKAADKIVNLGISQCPEGRKVFPRQTVYENLKLGAFSRKKGEDIEKEIKGYFDRFPILRERRNQKAGSLSGGEQQMLVICRALLAKPRLLLLDEPSMGLAPLVVENVFNIIKEVNKNGTAILLVEQNAKQALMIADYGYVLGLGKIVAADKACNLLASETVQQTYLGGAI
jgi:branched-chain amino acid transport system ATP-binding protein